MNKTMLIDDGEKRPFPHNKEMMVYMIKLSPPAIQNQSSSKCVLIVAAPQTSMNSGFYLFQSYLFKFKFMNCMVHFI